METSSNSDFNLREASRKEGESSQRSAARKAHGPGNHRMCNKSDDVDDVINIEVNVMTEELALSSTPTPMTTSSVRANLADTIDQVEIKFIDERNPKSDS